MSRYLKIRVTNIDNQEDEGTMTLRECGIEDGETFYADVFDHGTANIRAKKTTACGNIRAGDNMSLTKCEYEVVS